MSLSEWPGTSWKSMILNFKLEALVNYYHSLNLFLPLLNSQRYTFSSDSLNNPLSHKNFLKKASIWTYFVFLLAQKGHPFFSLREVNNSYPKIEEGYSWSH
jgi:hypothetical protein